MESKELKDDIPRDEHGNPLFSYCGVPCRSAREVFDLLDASNRRKAQDLKDTNPKDSAATNRLPLDLVPDTLVAMAALGFTEGAAKYGAYNWRVAGVRSSVYRAAMLRHFSKWWNGEDVDQKTGVPHLASIICGAGIILDAALVGKLTDDRPPKAPLGELIDSLEPKVAALREQFKDHKPHHHTALDKQV